MKKLYNFSPEQGITYTGLTKEEVFKKFILYVLRLTEKENEKIGIKEFIKLYEEKVKIQI